MIPWLALQFVMPLVLVAWMAIAPPHSRLGFGIQAVCTGAGLLAVGMMSPWLALPWWTPYAMGCLLLIAIVAGLQRRRPFETVLPMGSGAWVVSASFLALGVMAAVLASVALAGRTPPAGRLVNLAFPLESGTYLIVNGGSRLGINAHLKTLDPMVPRFRAVRGQSYGVDIVKIDSLGLRASGLRPSEPSAYHVYGAQVLAPCAGEIVFAVDGLPDMQVPQADRVHLAGNHVVLRCEDADIVLAHFRPDSLEVGVGSRLEVGDPIAAAGNSGNSDEPHLHIHAQVAGPAHAQMSADPLPIRINGRFLVRNERVSIH